MITADILSYVARDWAAAREAKDAYWADRVAELGPDEGLRIADELRRQLMEQGTGWPTDDERRADLQSHLRLSEIFRRAGSASRG